MDGSPPGAGQALSGVEQAVRALADADLDALSDDTLSAQLLALQRIRCRLDAAEAKVLARWDARRVWHPSGAKSGATWLAWKQRIPAGEARRRIHHARGCRTHPAIAEAWAAGAIDRSHVATLLAKDTPRARDAFATEHPKLVDAACTHGFVGFKRICDRWEQTVDPDGAEQRADSTRAARELHLSQTFGGMWFAKATLDPVSGDIVHGALSRIEQELFDIDWKTAKGRLGRDPLAGELDRTPAQRRADALVEMATRARSVAPGSRRPAPLFTVVVGLDTLEGPVLELFNRTMITPGTAAEWLADADVERIVFDGPSRVIEVGSRQRFFRGALRRAIEVRDRTCYHPSCDEPPERPEIDHIHEARKGGPTTHDNGRLACDYHNRWRNTHPDPPPDSRRDDAPDDDDPAYNDSNERADDDETGHDAPGAA